MGCRLLFQAACNRNPTFWETSMADLTIRKTRFYAGFSWLAEAARLFLKSPLMWLLMAIALCFTIFVFYGVFALSVTLLNPWISYYAAIGLGLSVLWIL